MSDFSAGLYGVNDYSEGGYKLFSASVSSSASTSSSAVRVTDGSASTAAQSQLTSAGTRIRESGAISAGATVITAVGYDYQETVGPRTGYGVGRYGIDVYGTNPAVAEVSATISATATGSATYIRERGVSGTVSAEAVGTANGVYSIIGSSTVSGSSDTAITYIRIRNVEGSTNPRMTISLSAREKWEPITSDTNTWTRVVPSATT